MIARDLPVMFVDFDGLIFAGGGVDRLEVDQDCVLRFCNACVDGMDFRLVVMKQAIVMAEEMAEQGCRGSGSADLFGAREEPATELFAIERGGGAVECDVGLAVWGEEKIGFVAGLQEIIEGREFPRFCAT